MEPEIFSDYICFEIDSYYHDHPYGPDRCPMCAGDLSKTEIEPSKDMRDEIVEAEKVGARVNSQATFLHICNKCRWWCIRDACELIDQSRAVLYHSDYLIFAIPGKKQINPFGTTGESTQPWLIALDDPDVEDGYVVRRLPGKLAGLIYKQSDHPEGALAFQTKIEDLSDYVPFLDMTKEQIARRKEKQFHKAERLKLYPGERVRIIEHVFEERGAVRHLIASKLSVAIVLSYEEYVDHMRVTFSSNGHTSWAEYIAGESNWLTFHLPLVKNMMEEERCFPVRITVAAPPSQAELAFWHELYTATYLYCEIGKICMVDVDYLEKMAVSGN